MNEKQDAFLILYVVYFLFALYMGDTILLKPIRLLTTFIHEFSHAIACWLTCGEVRGIEVFSNAGGVTKYVGGCRCIISPAGYLGEAFWGMVFVIAGGGRKTSAVAGGGLIAALLVSLCYAPNRTTVYLNLGYSALTALFLYLEFWVFSPLLAYLILFYGVMFTYYSIRDIFQHQVVQSREGSDAYHLYLETGRCCPPRCIGAWWLLLAVGMQITGLVMGVKLMGEDCEDAGWSECVFRTQFDFDFDFDFEFPDWEFDFWE